MKKMILLGCGLCSLLGARAQLDKGRVLLGGRVAFGSEKYTTTTILGPYTSKTNNQNYGLVAGIFVQRNLLAGISVGYSNKPSTPGASSLEEMPQVFNGGLLLQRYFPVGKGFYFRLGGTLDYAHGRSNSYSTQTYSGRDTYYRVSFGLAPGISYAIGRRVLLETGLNDVVSAGYDVKSVRESATGNNVQRARNFKAGMGPVGQGNSVPVTIGLNILLGK